MKFNNKLKLFLKGDYNLCERNLKQNVYLLLHLQL